MPTKAGRPCRAPGCPAVVRDGAYCPVHAQQFAVPDERPSAWARGYDARWRKIRRMVLAEQPLCVHCEREGYVVAATEVDHIVPLRQGGTHERSNLQPLCKSCHSRKTMRENVGGAK